MPEARGDRWLLAGLIASSAGCPVPPTTRALQTRPLTPVVTLALAATPAIPHDSDPLSVAQAFRLRAPVRPTSDTTIVIEAEEIQVKTPGWRALPYGANYYAATLANTFLSRQAYLGAPEEGPATTASVEFQVPRAGKYLALARYEAAYHFETRFTLRVEQDGQTRLERLYGARENLKVWPFGKGLARDVTQRWGAADAIVWEGVDAYVDLHPGVARLTLIADEQPEPAARRNVDVILLTTDEGAVKKRLAKEGYLPFDGMLTQAGDVFLRVRNHGDAVTLTVPNGTEHSPYWAHMRDWKAQTLQIDKGKATDWVETGSLLDTLSGGQWNVEAKGKGSVTFDLDVGVRGEDGAIETTRTFAGHVGNLALAYFGDTRYSRRIRTQDEAFDEILDYLKNRPVAGAGPTRTPVYGAILPRDSQDPAYRGKVDEFIRLMGINRLGTHGAPWPPGMLGVGDIPTAKLGEQCSNLREKMDPASVEVVTLGDEIDLPPPPANPNPAFRSWLRMQNVAASDVDPAAGGSYEKLAYDPSESAARSKPSLYYFSRLFAYRYGAQVLKERTTAIGACFPHALVGANFSPHAGHLYVGDTHQWITPFRDGSLTMPWSEDYIFQVPVGSPQVNSLSVDILRAGVRGKAGARIQYYVMAHDPGNTPNAWRRQFYGDVAHGVRAFNLFELEPLQVSYTENHVDAPEMYQTVRVALHELAGFEDIVQDGAVRTAPVGLWFSEAADVWDDKRSPFDAHERALYLMLRHHQIPLDIVVEGDDLGAYQALFLTDRHVSRAASRAIAAWVHGGGQLFATAGAGMLDELDGPNTVLRGVLGIEPDALEEDSQSPVRLEKQDLPFARAMDHVHTADGKSIRVISLRAPVTASTGTDVVARFDDGRAAMTVRRVGKGTAKHVAYLPGLTYLQPGIPRRPFDRRSDDTAMCHWLPTVFDEDAANTLHVEVERPVVASEPLVESTVIESPHGRLVPLINWSGRPLQGLTGVIRGGGSAVDVSLASHRPVRSEVRGSEITVTLDLDVADAILLRSHAD